MIVAACCSFDRRRGDQGAMSDNKLHQAAPHLRWAVDAPSCTQTHHAALLRRAVKGVRAGSGSSGLVRDNLRLAVGAPAAPRFACHVGCFENTALRSSAASCSRPTEGGGREQNAGGWLVAAVRSTFRWSPSLLVLGLSCFEIANCDLKDGR